MPGIKSTNAEIEARQDRCVQYYITVLPNFTQFINWYMEAFDKGKNTAVTDWKWTVENVAKEGATSNDVKRWRRVMQLEQQYKDSDNAKDKANIVMLAAKLEGIDVNKHEIEAHINSPKSIFKINLEEDEATKEDV